MSDNERYGLAIVTLALLQSGGINPLNVIVWIIGVFIFLKED